MTVPLSFMSMLSAGASADLFGRGRLCRLRPGATLFNQGDPSDHVAVVTVGRVKIAYTTSGGDEIVLAVRAGGGELARNAALCRRPLRSGA